jgi:hypothetical protein
LYHMKLKIKFNQCHHNHSHNHRRRLLYNLKLHEILYNHLRLLHNIRRNKLNLRNNNNSSSSSTIHRILIPAMHLLNLRQPMYNRIKPTPFRRPLPLRKPRQTNDLATHTR